MSAARRLAPPLAAVPVLACCAAAVVPGAPRGAAATERSPLGALVRVAANARVPGGRQVIAPFLLRNTSDEPVTLTAVEPSCGCLAPLVDRTAFDPAEPRTIAPGAAAVLILRADTAREPVGPSEHTADLAFRGPDGRDRHDTLKLRYAVGPHELRVDPPGVIVMQGAAATTTRTVTVTDARPDPVRVVRVLSPVDWVRAVPLGATPRPGGGVDIPFEITITGEHAADVAVTVEVDDPSGVYETIKLPVRARGLTLNDAEPTNDGAR